jgi:UDP-N-acetyl-D-mannosaminuronate dehydrogenase
MPFKADVDDISSSLSYKIKNLLDLYADKVLINDHYVQTDPDILPLEKALEKRGALGLYSPHSQYRNLDTVGKP